VLGVLKKAQQFEDIVDLGRLNVAGLHAKATLKEDPIIWK
jgi:hypothetical protein